MHKGKANTTAATTTAATTTAATTTQLPCMYKCIHGHCPD